MNRSMALHDPIQIEAAGMKVTIHVAGEHETAELALMRDAFQLLKAAMRLCGPVKIQAVSVKPPGLPWVAMKPDRVGHFIKRNA